MNETTVKVFETTAGAFAVVQADRERSGEICRLLRQAAGWMEEKGIKQWTPGQFKEEEIRAYFDDRLVYAALAPGGELAGLFTLQFGDLQYWGKRNDPRYAYLHRLTVAQPYKGIGLGGMLLSFAREQAKRLGGAGLRLDTVSGNVPLNRFYQSLGFRFMGINDAGGGRLVNLYEWTDPGEDRDAILLRYFGKSDFSRLAAWSESAERLKQWAGPSLQFPLTEEQLDRYSADRNRPAASDMLIYSAVHRESGETVGHLSLGRIDRSNRSARIGRVVTDPVWRGRGIGRRMIREALRIGFEALELHRIELGVFGFNKAAIACYEAEGLRSEGVLRECAKFGDGYADRIEMSMLEEEWRALHSRA